MVQFGQTLNEVVKQTWAPYAVPYTELKQALRPTTIPDDNSVHTESSYAISDLQKKTFERIYNESVVRLVEFYQKKSGWAGDRADELGEEVALCLAGGMEDVQGLIDRLQSFSKEVGLVLEFLELNAVAFSKIMKKFDKRTGSSLREVKIQELKTNHQFLYNGGSLKQIKATTDEWIKQLNIFFTKLRKNDTPKDIVFNPQESTIAEGSIKSVTWEDGRAVGSISASIHETKESKFIDRCIQKVNEEILMQKLRSPFFDSLPPRNSPPCFESSEMKLNQVLGAGEYCRIHEVVQFEVPESCHICFLHRGYEEGSLSSGASKKAAAAVLAAGNAGGTTDANNGVINSKPKDETHLTSKSKKSTNTTSLTSPESGAGHKRGVSWDDVPKEITKLSSAKTLTLAERNTMDLPKKPNDRVISFFSFEPDDNISDYDDFEEDHQDEFDHETRGFMKDHCLRAGEARYAVKRIKHELKGEDIIDAAIDLAREAQFLAGLSHPSIIKIRGTVGVAGHPKFSIVLDRLYETLDAKMLIWGEEVKKFQGPFPLFGFKKDKKALKKNWISRLLFAYDIAHAMDYLHSRGIVHRDLKPANIGFDVRGDVKIFDLGLAKELKPIQQVGPDQFHTSGIAGTRRYMAPEVAQVIPYGLSSDVYSYGIVVWEMMTLKPAYHNYTRAKHFKEVIVEGKRPKLPRSWPYVERNLLERCWAPKPADRPTFQAVCQLIKFGLPEESFDSTRSVDLALRSLRSTGRHMTSLELRGKCCGGAKDRCDTDDLDDLPPCCS